MQVTRRGNVSLPATTPSESSDLAGLGAFLTSGASINWITNGRSVSNSGTLTITPGSSSQLGAQAITPARPSSASPCRPRR